MLEFDDEQHLDSQHATASPPTASTATASVTPSANPSANPSTTEAKRLEGRTLLLDPTAVGDESDHVIDAKASRLALTQRTARQQGRSTALSWIYDENDEMVGAHCDRAWFERSELLALSTL